MSVDAQIIDGSNRTIVRSTGELIVSQYDYSVTSVADMLVSGTAYNLIKPNGDTRVVITGLLASAKSTVSNTVEAAVEIYTATAPDTTTVTTSLIQVGLTRFDKLVLLPLNILAAPGVWINAKTSDDDVTVSVFYYYLKGYQA